MAELRAAVVIDYQNLHTYVTPRPLEEIDAELNKLIAEITELLHEVEA